MPDKVDRIKHVLEVIHNNIQSLCRLQHAQIELLAKILQELQGKGKDAQVEPLPNEPRK